MAKPGRREFLSGTRAAAIGAVAALDPSPASAQSGAVAIPSACASFGWEIRNLNGNGANTYFRCSRNMVVNTVNIDLAFMITAMPAAPGFAEVLGQASVSRGAAPTFDNSGGHAYLNTAPSSDFGSVVSDNPNGLGINGNSTLGQDLFYSVILKAWVPMDGTASAGSRQVFAKPSLVVNAGDYFVFHMDHAGVPGDAEMQVVLGYDLL
jgi:hypothetical protein